MKSLWTEADRREIDSRVARLSPDAAPLWGRMSAPQMIAHLTQAVLMATGELPVADRKTPLRFPPLKQFAVYLMPFPRGLPTAPELLARRPAGDWAREVAELRGAVERFVSHGRTASWARHPAFGALSAHAWGVLTYRHADHHLRQFGA
jgi:hypothetical protein